MRTRAALGGIFASTAIVIIGWQAGTVATSSATPGPPSSATSPGAAAPTTPAGTSAASGTTTPTTSGKATTTPTAGSTKSGTYTGSSVNTQYGNVQVRIVVAGSKITDVIALKLTDRGGRSVAISNQAAPILRSEVLSSQSANVSTVGGATYTSDAYLTSLQAALDQAGI